MKGGEGGGKGEGMCEYSEKTAGGRREREDQLERESQNGCNGFSQRKRER